MRFYRFLSDCILILTVFLAAPISALDECKTSRQMLSDYTILMNPLRDLIGEFRPWRYPAASKLLDSSIETDGNRFQFSVDVLHYDPTEISVKIVGGFVVVNAKHEEKKDDLGFVSRQFMRRYPLPEGVKPEDVISELSTDGILTVSAPNSATNKGENDRVVTITMTGPKRKETKENVEGVGEEKVKSCRNNDIDDCSK